MAKLGNRSSHLTKEQQRHILDQAVPKRISLIKGCLKDPPTYEKLTAAGIHARALAGFIGITVNQGKLKPDDKYHDHGGGKSHEVKISDIHGGSLVDQTRLRALSAEDRDALITGFDTINREIAHLTFWPDSLNQKADTSPKADYLECLRQRIKLFSHAVIHLVRERMAGL